MQMAVQAAAFTPLCDDGKVGLSHVTHEQQDVDMAGLPAENRNGKSVRNSIISSNDQTEREIEFDTHQIMCFT